MTTLADEYPKEQARCRELLKAYQEIGPAGAFGAAVIEEALRIADKAAAEQDAGAMVAAFAYMKERA